MPITDILIKLAVSFVLGGAIGLERELSNKPAGLRTNMLICTGSTMMMALSGMVLSGPGTGGSDILRIAAGVITGIGFMGAGSIIRAGGHVQGLTTASTLWAVTALGLVVGAGYYAVAAIFTGLILLTLAVFRRIEGAVPKKRSFLYTVRVADMEGAADKAAERAEALGIRVEAVDLKRNDRGVLLTMAFSARDEAERSFRRALASEFEILEIRQP